MPNYYTDLRDTTHGQTLRTWETIDRGPYSARNMRLEKVVTYVLRINGGAGMPPEARGFTTREGAEAGAEWVMDDYDGRGIWQEWRECSCPRR